ncbi:MAG: histidine kinase [Anaerocolumna sp.]
MSLGTAKKETFSIRLKTQLIVVFVSIIVILIFAAGALIYQKVEVILKKQSAEMTSQNFVQNEYNITNFMKELETIQNFFLTFQELQAYMGRGWQLGFDSTKDAMGVFEYTNEIMNNYDYIQSIYFYGSNGEALGVSENSNETSLGEDKGLPFYSSRVKKALDKAPWDVLWFGGFTSKDFEISDTADDSIPVITVARNLSVNRKQSVTVIINVYETELMNLITKSDVQNERETFLVDGSGKIIGSAYQDRISQEFDIPIPGEIAAEGTYLMQDSMQVNFFKIDGTDWLLISKISEKVMYKDIKLLQKWFVLILCVAITVGIILASYWMYRLTKPLSKLCIAMKRMEEGTLGLQLEGNSKNELGMLGKEFNYMSKRIQDLIIQIRSVEKEKRILEKEALQSQINPHFLFNTLSNIKYMALIVKADMIVECVTALGNLIQPIYRVEGDFWSLEKELEYTRNYVKIMNYRFGNGIEIDYRLCGSTRTALLPRFILQPLIENAISHGFETRGGKGHIVISSTAGKDSLRLTIEDDGCGIPEEVLMKLQENLRDAGEVRLHRGSIGLVNVNRRLLVHFGKENQLHLESRKGCGTTIWFRIPFMEEIS